MGFTNEEIDILKKGKLPILLALFFTDHNIPFVSQIIIRRLKALWGRF